MTTAIPAIINVFVPGKPAPQGSKRYLGRAGGKGITVESSKAVAPWRAATREHLLARRTPDTGPVDGPVVVTLDFVMPRPTSTPKRSTPPAVKRPDLDKLVRAVLDAIGAAGIWSDDSQVTVLYASKRIAEPDEVAGCRIAVHRVAVHRAEVKTCTECDTPVPGTGTNCLAHTSDAR